MKIRMLIAALAALFMFTLTGFTTYAQASATPIPATKSTVSAVDEKESKTNAFTPSGTSTVTDNATDEDGKEFYTIVTPNENVFYLIIDKQRETENVYFLNAVTEADLLALAAAPEKGSTSAIPGTSTQTETEPTPTPTPETPATTPEKGSNSGMMILIIAIVLIGGGGAYYFKIYKPKQEQDDSEEDYNEYEENSETDEYGDFEDTDPEENGDFEDTEPEDE